METISEELIRRFPFIHIGSPTGWLKWLMAALGVVACCILVYGIMQKTKQWMRGVGELAADYPERRLGLMFRYGLRQRRISSRFAGIMHGLIFAGFLGLVCVSFVFLFELFIMGPVFGNYFVYGRFYLWLSCAGDTFGLMVLIGLALAAARRYITRPVRFGKSNLSDALLLILPSVLVLSGFLVEGLRIAIAGFPNFERWSYVGWIFGLMFDGISGHVQVLFYRGLWWFHMFCGFSLIAMFAFSKTGHGLLALLNIYHGNFQNEFYHTKYKAPLSDSSSGKEESREPALPLPEEIADFTAKDLLDLDACVGCGVCQDNCPAWITEQHLSPKRLIAEMKNSFHGKPNSLAEENIWCCTECGACAELCPVLIEHLPKIIKLKRREFAAQSELEPLFANLAASGLPYGIGTAYESWLADMQAIGVRIVSGDTPLPEIGESVLYFPGSAVANESSAKDTALAFAGLMQSAGINVYMFVRDSGDLALRSGNVDLFRALARHNIAMLAKFFAAMPVVCSSPHDYDILAKYYCEFEDMPSCRVLHHTELLAELVKAGRIRPVKGIDKIVVWHDPCFLGRYNGIYDAPRQIIEAIPGATLAETERRMEKSFCCGGGSGVPLFVDNTDVSMGAFRAKEIQFAGADIICVGCPFCKIMLAKGIGEMNIGHIGVSDIAELLFASIDRTSEKSKTENEALTEGDEKNIFASRHGAAWSSEQGTFDGGGEPFSESSEDKDNEDDIEGNASGLRENILSDSGSPAVEDQHLPKMKTNYSR